LRDAAIKVVNLSTSQPVLLPSGFVPGTDQLLTLKSPHSWLDRHWFGVLLLHAILLQAITFVLRPMTSYRAIELGAPVFWLGALSACFALVPLLVAIPSGRATDRFGERLVMVAGATVTTISGRDVPCLSRFCPGSSRSEQCPRKGRLPSVVGE
jgi:hypothetical protein